MSPEALFNFEYRSALSSTALAPETGGSSVQPSSSDDLLHQNEHYQAVVASLLNASFGNFPGSLARVAQMNEGVVSERTNPTLVHETANFNFGWLSSSVADDSSAISRVPQLHRNVTNDVFSYLRLPPLPVCSSSSSNSMSSTVDGSFNVQQQQPSQTRKRKQQKGGFTSTCPPEFPRSQNLTEIRKKPRLEFKKDTIPRQQNVVESFTKLEGIETEKQPQMRLQQVMCQVPAAYPLDAGVCTRRIMQYMYHLRCRPSDNSIDYWRKFVAEYYAPCAKKRWCLSLYDNVGHQPFGAFSRSPMDVWQCDLCGSKSGRGFEAYVEALPRLNKITFESGVIDEFLYLDLPRELIKSPGSMMLEYGKAVHESVYEHFRVVHEGRLCITFTPDLKILSWEFCTWRHEELLPRSLVAPQICKLVQTVQKYQSSVHCGGTDRVSPHDLQANCNAFLVAGCQLMRNLELQPVDNMGFPKRYVRCLEISEIVNSMKDLMTFSLDKNIGPIESLRNYPRETSRTKPPEDELQGKESARLPSVDRRKLMTTCLVDNNENYSSDIASCRPMMSTEEAFASPGYYSRLLRQNSLNSDMSKARQEPFSSFNRFKPGSSSKSLRSPKTSNSGLIKNLSVDDLSGSCSSVCKQNTQGNLIHKLLQEMVNNSRTVSRGGEADMANHKVNSSSVTSLPDMTRGTVIDGNRIDLTNSRSAQATSGNAMNSFVGKISSAASNVEPSGICSNESFTRSEEYLPEVVRKIVFRHNGNRLLDSGCGDMC